MKMCCVPCICKFGRIHWKQTGLAGVSNSKWISSCALVIEVPPATTTTTEQYTIGITLHKRLKLTEYCIHMCLSHVVPGYVSARGAAMNANRPPKLYAPNHKYWLAPKFVTFNYPTPPSTSPHCTTNAATMLSRRERPEHNFNWIKSRTLGATILFETNSEHRRVRLTLRRCAQTT